MSTRTSCSPVHAQRVSNKEAGFTVVAMAVTMLGLIGMVGLAVDIGRIYIGKAEAQTFTDSASLAATLELDGTMAGFTRARARVAANTNRWNFQSSTFSTVSTAFAKDTAGPWEEFPALATGYRFARATATIDVPVYFLSIFKLTNVRTSVTPAAFLALTPASFTSSVKADSASGQQLKTLFREGLFPFSPYAHNTTAPHFGLVPGQKYTLRWPSSPRKNQNVCAGDNDDATIALSQAGGGSERGFIEETSADIIRQTIVDDYQTAWRGVGSTVNMTGGGKSALRDALLTRISQDGNASAKTYTDYVASAVGTGRRVVAAPINTGYPDYKVVQIGAFFLLDAGSYDVGGNKEWCAEYLGAWVQGAKTKGAADGSGAYVVRLIQ